MTQANKATLFVVSAPSGAGKTSLVKALCNQMQNVQVSISHTTRPQRPGEQHGVDYHFIDQAEFVALLEQGLFLEHAQVFGNYYGTSQQWVKETLAQGIDVVLEIDWQGAEQVSRIMDCCRICVLPPSLDALHYRLTARGQDESTVIEHRMAQAQEEMSHFAEADYVIINDDFETALAELKAIVAGQRCRTPLQQVKQLDLLQKLLNTPVS